MGSRGLLVVLIVVATALFGIGVAIEGPSREIHSKSRQLVEGEAHSEEGEETTQAGEAHLEGSPAEAAEGTVLGINLESAPFVILVIVGSLLLALGVWLTPSSGPLLMLTGLAMALFALLDVREVLHQLGGAGGLVIGLAALVALLHAFAAVSAITVIRARTG